jgi:glucokinase
MKMIVLAGDIGGTKTLLQLAEYVHGRLRPAYEKRYASGDYEEFLPLVKSFVNDALLSSGLRAEAACFGIAGPVSGRTAVTSNLPWKISADELESELGIKKVRLINDFQSVGYGIAALAPEDLVTLQEGTAQPQGTQVIIGAGTGLGQGFLVWQNDHYEVVASEGGHTSFAPTSDMQIELLRYLQKRYHWATWERAVSGRGLANIFDFLLEIRQPTLLPALEQALQTEDRSAAISRFGLGNEDPTAAEALDIFTRLYGAQAGNLALLGLATGGVFVAGGVAPKIIEKMKDGVFMQAFLDKQDHKQDLLKAMPVKVIINAEVGLLGSAVAATRL